MRGEPEWLGSVVEVGIEMREDRRAGMVGMVGINQLRLTKWTPMQDSHPAKWIPTPRFRSNQHPDIQTGREAGDRRIVG